MLRDRLWFFAGYQYLRDYDSQPGADPTVPENLRAEQAVRETHLAARAGWQLMQSYHQERWVNPEPPTW